MFNFKDLNITADAPAFVGDKIKIKRLIDKPIIIHAFAIEPSAYEGKGDRLKLAIEFEGTRYINFTSAKNLKETIVKVPKDKFPFTTTIVEKDEYLYFT